MHLVFSMKEMPFLRVPYQLISFAVHYHFHHYLLALGACHCTLSYSERRLIDDTRLNIDACLSQAYMPYFVSDFTCKDWQTGKIRNSSCIMTEQYYFSRRVSHVGK